MEGRGVEWGVGRKCGMAHGLWQRRCGVLNHSSTTLGKCRALNECCTHSLAHSFLTEEKYEKMYLKVLMNRTNIWDRYHYVFIGQGVKVRRISIYTWDSGTFSCFIVTPLHLSHYLYLHKPLICIKTCESIQFLTLKIAIKIPWPLDDFSGHNIVKVTRNLLYSMTFTTNPSLAKWVLDSQFLYKYPPLARNS